MAPWSKLMTKTELWANPDWCSKNWGNRRGKPWTGLELVKALGMRLSGCSDVQIAAELGRTVRSVEGKLGYLKS